MATYAELMRQREAAMKMVNQIEKEMAEMESELYSAGRDMFGIYQLRDGEDLHYHRFESLDRLEKSGLKVEKDNYRLVYIAPLQEGQTLDDIFEEFNLFRPEDFTGHSLSVSDIVLLHKNGENHAMYVDSFGFRGVPQFLEKQQEQENEKPFIDHYYVVEDLQKSGPLEIKKYADMQEALQAYFSLPNHKQKAFGIQNSLPLPGSLDFIQCINGVDRNILDYQNVEGWDNPEIINAAEQVDVEIDLHDAEIAYKIGDRYFTIQHTEGGFDYTFYGHDYRELDGGVYENPGLTIEEAIEEILEDEGLAFEDCQVINYEEFMERTETVNRIVPHEEQIKAEVMTGEPAQTLTFYVAECMEFPSLGEYHDHLTFQEAVHLYEAIPSERMNGIKGIGFVLHTEGTDEDLDTSMGVLEGQTIDVDTINMVPELRDHPLVQQAIRDLIEQFPDAEVWDVETQARLQRENAEDLDRVCNELAKDIDQFSKMVDPYGYRDAVKNREENISKIYSDLQKGEEDYIRDWIQGVIDEEEPAEDVKEAAELLKRMDDLTERRARNPLTKVEELEEANYNQIDGMLNNSMVKDIVKSVNEGVRVFSIVERLELAKEQLSNEKAESKPPKDTVKKPEMGME
ncbi:MAG: YodL domain-containing protein [Blautia sp.]